MDLLIRSQDKKRLIKSEKLITVEFTGETECEIWNDTVKLGTYKNIERALEVLNEIEERICLLNTISLVHDNNSLISFKNAIGEDKAKGLCFPYQMPKE